MRSSFSTCAGTRAFAFAVILTLTGACFHVARAQSTNVAPTPPEIYQIISTGQSLSMGYEGIPALTTNQPYGNQMFETNALPYQPFVRLIAPATGGYLNSETPESAMANMLTNLATAEGAQFESVVSLNARISTGYSGLEKGGPYGIYETNMGEVRVAHSLAMNSGTPYSVAAVTVIHGETDEANGVSASAYEADLEQWQQDYQADSQAITSQTNTIPLFTDQMSSWQILGHATPQVALGQWDAARDNPASIYLVTPLYIFDYAADGLHLTNYSYRRLGEYFGKVMKEVLVDGQPWLPLSPGSITLSGNIITAVFNVPVQPLVLDTAAVSSQPNFGFEYADSLDSASISSSSGAVSIVAPNTVQITLTQIPTGANPVLRYAYTATPTAHSGAHVSGAPKGNLRDSDMTPALYEDANVPAAMGNYLHNWGVTFDQPIVVVSGVPGPPGGVLATGGSGQATVSFSAPAYTGGYPVSGYTVTSSPPGAIDTEAGASQTTHILTGLNMATSYTFSVAATNVIGAGAPSAPSNAVIASSNPTFTVNNPVTTSASVVLSGTVNPNGTAGPAGNPANVLVSWQYGPAAGNYTVGTAATPVGKGANPVTVSYTGARKNFLAAVYHAQLVISSSAGTFYGPDEAFSFEAPTVALNAPVESATGSTLSATIDPNALDTQVYFQYGLSTVYGNSTAPQDIGSGVTGVTASASLAGLAPYTAYHYRLVTVNSLGTIYGADQVFATPALFGTAAAVWSGEAAPGIPGAVFSVFGNPAINDLDHTAFQATVTGGGVTTTDNSGIWADSGTNGLLLMAQTGIAAPGYGGQGPVGAFAKLSDPVYADDDAIAFLGTLAVTGTVTAANETGVWATTSGTLALVARAGDPAPDVNGAISAGGPVFATIPQCVLPEQGGVIILATLQAGVGGVIAGTSQGIWAVGTNGILTQVIRTGDALTVNGNAKVISGLTIFNAPAASTGQTRHFNNPGDLLYKAAFTDGSTGIVQSVFP